MALLLKSRNKNKQKTQRIKNLAASTQNTIKYTAQFENGLMDIVDDEHSRMYEIDDISYQAVSEDKKTNIVDQYGKAIDSIGKNERYQLVVISTKVSNSLVEHLLMPLQNDDNDVYRKEMNQIITEKFALDDSNFNTKRYAVFTTKAKDRKNAERQLSDLSQSFVANFKSANGNLQMHELSGLDRLKIMYNINNPHRSLSVNYRDIELSNLNTKSFVAPSSIQFKDSYFNLNDSFARVLYVRDYPQILEDRLIRELTNAGHEVVISIHAKPYDMQDVRKKIKEKQTLNEMSVLKQQKRNAKDGVSEDMISGASASIREAAADLRTDIDQYGQKMYSGIFSIMLVEDSLEALNQATTDIKDAAGILDVFLDEAFYRQEEALNTILPLGKPYLDVESNYMRDMTTANVATQVPFTSVELQSVGGEYYGQNQITKNIITVNRKNTKELITPSGLVLGSSGSGKSMTVKDQIISTLLNHPNDRIIIVDPESEYLAIAKEFGAQILDISSGTDNHLNIMDIADQSGLDDEDRKLDLVKEKTGLISELFKANMPEITSVELGIIDRVARETYKRYADPTLVEFQEVLSEQPEDIAQELAISAERFTVGSMDIFSYPTNVDLSANFLVFNIKNLNPNLKPFAMRVILDQIWNQIVSNQNKVTTWLYFDEMHMNFNDEESASWFASLWARVRKYGAIPTGITQNVTTLMNSLAGKNIIQNTEFMIILRQKSEDMKLLNEILDIDEEFFDQYAGETVPQGTGIIRANGIAVPFVNKIPENTKLFSIMNTDATTNKSN